MKGKKHMANKIRFLDNNGTFHMENITNIDELYFPLCNEAGLMSSITPRLHGDIKTGQSNFLLAPVTVEDLHNTRSARNFWIYVHGRGPWSVSGNSAVQNSKLFMEDDKSNRKIEAGLLWHKVIYDDTEMNLRSEILTFVPVNKDKLEIMCISIENTGSEAITITPSSAIPMFCRSAENIRDHRHVTSLVNRAEKKPFGITVKPEIIFDERGHRYNNTVYYVFGSEADGVLPTGSMPSVHDFIGSSGSLEWPYAVVKNISPESFDDSKLDGVEYVGALRFKDTGLQPGEKRHYIILTGICDSGQEAEAIYHKYNTLEKVYRAFEENKTFWTGIGNKITFDSGLDGFSNWIKWVGIQPVLRKIYGCSFLPYHDYGKGGRGWRDLWQDCLSLILQNPEEARQLLLNNFGGIRADGTNATIIGAKPGEFIADRNNIARVWMDHGAWPYLTTKLYIDQSGDFSLLLEKQHYFQDGLIERAAARKEFSSTESPRLRDGKGNEYCGSVMEHMLVQHLTIFFNVGEHNMIRLEGADWNDTLDMARDRGESTAFTAFYGSNLISMSELLLKMGTKLGIESIEVFEELKALLDAAQKDSYESIEYKKEKLKAYFKTINSGISGNRQSIKLTDLAADLKSKGEWIFRHIRANEWIDIDGSSGFFNGYYNNDGKRVDEVLEHGVRMNLTGQVFTTMFGLATEEQVVALTAACDKYLKDPETGGYRLNTDLGSNKLNFGRGFAFAYGEKENGATFCHMTIMYMNALYKRGFVDAAYEVFKSLYSLCMNAEVSCIYPGIPEYFNASGKGLYHYLTGSASWLMLTVANEMFGVRGEFGELVIEPRLMSEQFNEENLAAIHTWFKGKPVSVQYLNSNRKDYRDYSIKKAELNNQDISRFITRGGRALRLTDQITGNAELRIKVTLD